MYKIRTEHYNIEHVLRCLSLSLSLFEDDFVHSDDEDKIKRFGRASITYSVCPFSLYISIFFRNFLLQRISSLEFFFSSFFIHSSSSRPRISQHRRLLRCWVISFPPRLLGSAESHPGQSFPQWRLSKMDVPHVGRCSRLLVFQDLLLAGYLVPQRPLRRTR